MDQRRSFFSRILRPSFPTDDDNVDVVGGEKENGDESPQDPLK